MLAVRRNLLRTLSSSLNPSRIQVPNVALHANWYASSLTHNKAFFFSEAPKPNKTQEAPKAQKPEEKSKPVEEEIIEENLQDFMKDSGLKSDAIFEFTDKDVFKFNGTVASFKKQRALFGGMSTLWGVVSGLTYVYLSTYGAIIPVLISVMAFRGFYMANYSASKIITKMHLADAYHVKITMLTDDKKEEMCRIEDIEVKSIADLSKIEQVKAPKRTYLIKADLKDVSGKKKFENMSFIVDPKLTEIENPDLFKSILYAKVKDVAKFRLIRVAKPSENIKDDLPLDAQRDPKFEFSEEEFAKLKAEVNKGKGTNDK